MRKHIKIFDAEQKNVRGLGWGERYINPPKGPPSCTVYNDWWSVDAGAPPAGSHITNDDDWAIAPPQLLFKEVANVQNNPVT